ncbi:MAG: electron transport complex subunit RsxA [Clostridiales bacterium]|nr:electron transport complex subunit RsxA [Clostridiales bacterium]
MIVSTFITAVFTENLVFYYTYGICPFLGVSQKSKTAIGMGLTVILVITLSSILSYLIYTYLLIPFELEYLQILLFILIIASLVQLMEILFKRFIPALYKGLGIYLPLVTTNCAVLGTANAVITKGFMFIETVFYSLFIGVGFLLALILMSGIRERLEKADVPKSFKGFPLALIAAGIMAMAFSGLSGLNFFG